MENRVCRDETVDCVEDALNSETRGIVVDGGTIDDNDQNLNETKENEIVIKEDRNVSRMEETMVDESSSRKKLEKESDQVQTKSSKSYADVTKKNVNIFYKQLLEIPTELDSNGNEIVVFDEIMVVEGSKRWERTLCGYFVGYEMSVNELRYNLRKTWSRHGFKDIIDFRNGVYFMKFNSDEGLEFIVNNGPYGEKQTIDCSKMGL
ncbi:zinc knuckle CX2CX4HX4C containing protein [Tanacetum coccineum]|uniref:Zinc knuckle CX2CX4HX4C containing protein n=1 Tax=Tanacetum coccineum TaxID=301880 RepID=A0ABQ5D9Q4_9ASTR